MPLTKIIRLGLIHVAVALTLVPINGVLNRIMISNLGLAATLVAALSILPYLCSPMQIWIGNFSDRHPVFGLHRTPYIVLGLMFCVTGTALAPHAAFALHADIWSGLPIALLAFGAWGIGFNFATVAYLALATDLAGEAHRARTVGVMWFMLIVSVIVAGITLARALDPYTPAALFRAIYWTCGIALLLGVVGLIRLERREGRAVPQGRAGLLTTFRQISANPQARRFFIYLVLLLIALLGQDILLEPFAADTFGVPVRRTTEYTSLWGAALLIALLVTSPISRRYGKRRAAFIGGAIATIGLVLIGISGFTHMQAVFIPGLIIFGFGSGMSTASNLALMLDMTIPGQIGMFVGAWGTADACARMLGALLGGIVRDSIVVLTANKPAGYIAVFFIEALALAISLWLLRGISVDRFRESNPTITDIAALAGDTSPG